MGKTFLAKICCIVFCVSTLTACTLNKAMQSYEKGDYLSSIRIVTNKLNEKQEYPRNSLKKSWLESVHLSLNRIENLPNVSIDQKIKRLETIYQARYLLDAGFYRNEFTAFNQRYPMPSLKLDMAKLYYQKGNAIQLNTTENYRQKAEAYQTGASYADYLDIAKLATRYQFEYATRLAGDYYQSGLLQVRIKNYQAASEDFAKASEAYAAHGKYKDAAQQFSKYDQLWRTEKASQLFLEASQKEKSARYKVDFREISTLYQDANTIYSPYGRYKNSADLARTAAQKGLVRVAYFIDQEKGDDRCGKYSSERLSERFEQEIKTAFKAAPFTLLDRRSDADIVVYFDYSSYYSEGRPEKNNQVQSVLDHQGQVFKFNQQTEFQKNKYEIRLIIESKGAVGLRKVISLEDETEQSKVFYSGDVPAGYRNKSTGTLKKQDELCQGLTDDLERQVNRVLDDIVNRAKRI